jgi:DNA-binding LytR/AlgR family response regulator
VIRVLLVDDEGPARSELRYLLAAHRDVQVVGEAASGAEALELVRDVDYDVLFLDVEMPGATGLETAPQVRDRSDPPAIVFVTAHEQYAVDAFAVEAFDYLLKPVDPDRLARVVERLRERTSENVVPLDRIPVVGASGATELVDPAEIHFVQADGDYSRGHTNDRSYQCTSSLAPREPREGRGCAPRRRPLPAPARGRGEDGARRVAPPVARGARAARALACDPRACVGRCSASS